MKRLRSPYGPYVPWSYCESDGLLTKGKQINQLVYKQK